MRKRKHRFPAFIPPPYDDDYMNCGDCEFPELQGVPHMIWDLLFGTRVRYGMSHIKGGVVLVQWR